MSESAPTLLPCPFDDGQGLHGTKVRSNDRDGCGPADTWWVQCKCGAEGPNARGPDEAIAAWNRRSDGNARADALEEARQIAFDQSSDDPAPGAWNDACEQIADRINALKQEAPPARSDGWQPISSAPKDGSLILLYEDCVPASVQIGQWQEDGECWAADPGGWSVEAAMWQPLPSPPSRTSPDAGQPEPKARHK